MNNQFEIGVPLNIQWHFKRPDGENYSLLGQQPTVYCVNARGRFQVPSVIMNAESGYLSFTLTRAMQVCTGPYSFLLRLRQNGMQANDIIYRDAVILARQEGGASNIQEGAVAETLQLFSVGEFNLYQPTAPVGGSDGFWYFNGQRILDNDDNEIAAYYSLRLTETGENRGRITIYKGSADQAEPEVVAEFDAVKEALALAAADHTQAESDHTRAGNDHTRAESDHSRAASDHNTASSDHGTYIRDHNTASSDHTRATNDNTRAAADHLRADEDHSTASGDHSRANTDHNRAETDHERAATDHTAAGNDHGRANTDHIQANEDHTRAESDHTRAESDHTHAGSDHTRAGNDHTTATRDHDTAVSDHRTAAADHTLATTDHNTAAADHLRAEDEHTRAVGDHNLAVEDHRTAMLDNSTAMGDHRTAADDHTQAASDHTQAAGDHMASQAATAAANTARQALEGATGVINVNYVNSHAEAYASKSAARSAVAAALHSSGVVLTYLLADGWHIEQYVGGVSDPSDWTADANWEPVKHKTVMLTEDEYDELVEQGAVVPGVFYLITEEDEEDAED